MRCLLLSWVVWLTLGVTMLNTAAAFMPTDSFLPQSSDTAPAFNRSHSGIKDRFFKETSSVSQGLSLQCARQSKRALARVRSFYPFSRVQQKTIRLWSVAVPVSLPFVFFFPRKFSPSSAEDDPFLS